MTSKLTNAPTDAQPDDTIASRPFIVRLKSLCIRIWPVTQFVSAFMITLAFLVYLLFVPSALPLGEAVVVPRQEDVVEVVGPGVIHVRRGSPFDSKVHVIAVRKESITDPVMIVTGRVAASLRPGNGKGNDLWQFDSPEVLTAYTDWQKAQADITFAEIQLAAVKQLADARLISQRQVVARLERLVSAGTDTLKDLAAEKANQIQVEITGRKEIHEAETAARVAKRAEAALARHLQQAGLDPELLGAATSDMDIVLADVPEGKQSHVKVGQGCQATFFGIPNERFSGKVNSIAPVLSKERRSLRVLFVIHDPRDQLRPGMFAEIGLGTDPRDTLLVPADSILHIGRADYVMTSGDANTWKVTDVQVGEPRNEDVEILSGLKPSEKVIGKGAILFKPLVVRSLQSKPTRVAKLEVDR